jgi:integrase
MGRRSSNEGTMRKRADGYWEARVRLPDGGRKSLYAKSQQEVRRKLTEALRNVDRGVSVPHDERMRLASYLAEWLREKQSVLGSPRTYDRYEELVRLHIVPRIGKRQLAHLTWHDVKGLQEDMLAERGDDGQAKYSPSTVKRVRTVLYGALKDAVKRDLLARNPCDLVKAPASPRREMQTWSPAQARAFLVAAAGDRLYALFALALSTGMRQGELFGLRWSDVDLERAELHIAVTRQKSRSQGLTLVAAPKTESGRRTVPLITGSATGDGLNAVAMLKAHRMHQAAERLTVGPAWTDHDLVFCTPLGTPLDPSNVDRHVYAPLVKRARLPLIRFHDLRHTAATNLLAAGVTVEVVSRMLGHADVATTLRFYRHVRPSEMRHAANVMSQLLGG